MSYVAVIDYGAGNIGSVLNMFKKIGVAAKAAATPESVADAARILLPGVGAFDHCMQALNASGLRDALERAALSDKKPFLGICVGQQMMLEGSDEGKLPGLGWIPGRNVRFADIPGRRVPHMGWTEVAPTCAHPLFDGYAEPPCFYFVHSYHPACAHAENVLATADYGGAFCCAVHADNVVGVQFHPEKSHKYGMKFLINFAGWRAKS
ncbi:MAG: imidazole glycerol phosphate synthase subunit HisH [Rhodospirillales bacterium]|nr:imidazole glycerol phosphate synthase subunit HisH [Rhodospirillales bacterium]USO07194.1 MAG: imidazole glycerol phosphate synthase subunit HisH [Rhodospirillales bacterium]